MSVTYTFEDGQESLHTISGVEKIFQMLKGVPHDKAKEILKVAMDNLDRTAVICKDHLPSYHYE